MVNRIHNNEGGLFGSGPHWATEDGRLKYFAIFDKEGTGIRWFEGHVEVLENGKKVWEGKDVFR